MDLQLLLLVKDTKFESKSQQRRWGMTSEEYCFYWSKIQNLKANHNPLTIYVSKRKIAFTGQRYKIWKQITTDNNYKNRFLKLLLLVKDTKFESKSQQITIIRIGFWNCFYWSKIQNLKANHNQLARQVRKLIIAFTGQRYKIWNQITTRRWNSFKRTRLLLLVKDTKFESKSQPDAGTASSAPDCFYWSKIQNLKANHNQGLWGCKHSLIAFTGQRYKIWKQITTYICM